MILTMFRDLQFDCSSEQSVPIPQADGSFYLLCPYPSGRSVMSRFNVRERTPEGEDTLAICCAMLLVLCVAYRVVALGVLYRLALRVKDATK